MGIALARDAVVTLNFARRLVLALLAAALLAAWPGPVQASAACSFSGGFATLRELIGSELVGECLEDERHAPRTGNAEQRTTRGLLVWRKAENVTAFTNGHHTWIAGPAGLVDRPNTERFAWEEDGVLGTVDVPEPMQEPAETGAPPGAGVDISGVVTGWGPEPDASRKFPYIRFTVTNRSPETVPVYDTRLRYSADFFDPVTREPFGSGLGVPEQLGLAGLPPSFSTSVAITSTVGADATGGAHVPARLTVELYQGNAFTQERRHIGTLEIRR